MTDAHESQASETTSRKHLSDAEILAYTSADPFALTSTKPWLYETKSPYLRKIAIVGSPRHGYPHLYGCYLGRLLYRCGGDHD